MNYPWEGQRHKIQSFRQEVLEGKTEVASELERLITLRTIDEMWSDYLARLAEFKQGLPWLNLGQSGLPRYLSLDHKDAQYVFAKNIHTWFTELESSLPVEIERRVKEALETWEIPTSAALSGLTSLPINPSAPGSSESPAGFRFCGSKTDRQNSNRSVRANSRSGDCGS